MNHKFDELAKGLAQSVTGRAGLGGFGVGLAGMWFRRFPSGVLAVAILVWLSSLSAQGQASGPGSALSFDGTGGYVSIATTGSLTGVFTVELWANPNDPVNPLGLVGSRRPIDYSFCFIFWLGNLVHGDLGNGYTWISTAANALLPYSTNIWYHIAYVVTQTNYTIYVNGLPTASASYAPDNPTLYDGNHQLVIGNFAIDLPQYTLDEYMNGVIDEVRIWSTARCASEIQTNAFRYLTGSEPGLMGYWRFDEGMGTDAEDASGHGFTGTLINAVSWVPSSYPNNAPVIIEQPVNQTVPAGGSASFAASVFASPPLSYHWRLNSTDIAGATNSILTLSNVRPSDAGSYSVVVTNSFGAAVSSNALLTVVAPSVRISAAGDAVLIWWPTNASGFALEASTHLGASEKWTNFPGPISVVGDQNVVAAVAVGGSKFFRLQKR